MKTLLDGIAMLVFDMMAWSKGYTFKEVTTPQENDDATTVFASEAFSFPPHLDSDVQRFKKGAVNFIAYHKGLPVGTVRLQNPKIINRAWEHYGVDKNGDHHEIQSLIVKKEFRDGSQFVMLGLVKCLYAYSLANSITTWSACGQKSLYMTMRRYCKNIKVIDIDFQSTLHPVTKYLYQHGKVETYFIMDVKAFAPLQILKKVAKKLARKSSIIEKIGNLGQVTSKFEKLNIQHA